MSFQFLKTWTYSEYRAMKLVQQGFLANLFANLVLDFFLSFRNEVLAEDKKNPQKI